jgi:hypothetical protein
MRQKRPGTARTKSSTCISGDRLPALPVVSTMFVPSFKVAASVTVFSILTILLVLVLVLDFDKSLHQRL